MFHLSLVEVWGREEVNEWAATSGQPSFFFLKNWVHMGGLFFISCAFLLLRFHLIQRELHRRDFRGVLRDKIGTLDMSERNGVQNVKNVGQRHAECKECGRVVQPRRGPEDLHVSAG